MYYYCPGSLSSIEDEEYYGSTLVTLPCTGQLDQKGFEDYWVKSGGQC